MSRTETGTAVELAAGDLPAYCPHPKMTLWNQHPRVFLEIAVTGDRWRSFRQPAQPEKANVFISEKF